MDPYAPPDAGRVEPSRPTAGGGEEAGRVITSILKKMRPQRPHLAALVVLLLFSFTLTGLVAWQAYDAARGEKVRAEDGLRRYAAQIGDSYRRNAEPILIESLIRMFKSVEIAVTASASEGVVSSDVARLVELYQLCECLDATSVRSTFRYDFATGRLDVQGDTISSTLRTRLAAQMLQRVQYYNGVWGVGTLAGGAGGPGWFVMYLMRDPDEGPPVDAYGLITDLDVLRVLLGRLWPGDPPIVTAPLDPTLPPETLASATATLGDGTVVFKTPHQFTPEHVWPTHLHGIAQGITLTVALNPEIHEAFLVGGMPRSRLPALFGILAMTAALTVVAIFMIRREAEITRLRSDFIAGVSHELRTPLAQIRMFAETLMLNRVRTESERHRSLEIIDQEARRLAHLVENVLLFARSERRRSRIKTELTDLSEQLRETIHGFAVLCRTRDIELRPELQEGVVAPVDQGALRQIMLNLLDNAVKYGPLRQRVTVGLALFDDFARIWVDDQGPGIPSDDRVTVFESFYRLGRDVDSAVAGSGIGLAIVRELAVLHGGRAWIDDAPGGGARVVVELPGAYVRPEVAVGGWAVA
ncbi:MAG: sensor histidine kinase [Longimicrobiales bacterium]